MKGSQYSPEQNNQNHQTLVTSRLLGCTISFTVSRNLAYISPDDGETSTLEVVCCKLQSCQRPFSNFVANANLIN